MKQLLSLILITLLISIYGCSDETTYSLGENLIDSELNILKVDTITVSLSTLKIDSLSSSGLTTALVGATANDELGTLKSQTYFKVSPPSSSGFESDEVFDSICIVLQPNGYACGDTTQKIALSIHEVLETIETHDDGLLYNSSSFKYNEEPLGTKDVLIYPNKTPEITIRLSDELGQLFLEKLTSQDSKYTTTTNFLTVFKGLTLKASDEDCNSLYGFSVTDTTNILRLYTHQMQQTKEEIVHNFSMYDESCQFNQITTNYGSSPLSQLKYQRDVIEASTTNNTTYLQGGSGILTRIDFPYISNMIERDDLYVLSAELQIVPESKSYYNFQELSSTVLYYSYRFNELNSLIYNSNDQIVYGTPNIDAQYGEDNYISFDITSIMSTYFESNEYWDPKEGLILSYNPDTYNSNAETLKLLQSTHDKQNTRLIIYFSDFK